MRRFSRIFLHALIACLLLPAYAIAAPDVAALIAVVALPDATWEERSAAEAELAKLPREAVLRKLVPQLKDSPDGPDYGEPVNAEADRDAPPHWQAHFSTWRVWKAHLPDEDSSPQLQGLTADLLQLANETNPRVELARLTWRYWSDRSEETLANWLRDGRMTARVRNEAAVTLMRHRKSRYYAEVRGLMESASIPLKESLFIALVNATRYEVQRAPDSVVISVGFQLLEMHLTQKEVNEAVHTAGMIAVHLDVDFAPDEQQPTTPEQIKAHRQKTVENARAWWKANGKRIEEEAAKVRPRAA